MLHELLPKHKNFVSSFREICSSKESRLANLFALEENVEALFLVSEQVVALVCYVELSSSLSSLGNYFEAGSVAARGVYQKQTVVIVACQEALFSQLYVSSKESQVADLALLVRLVLELGDFESVLYFGEVDGEVELVVVVLGDLEGLFPVALGLQELGELGVGALWNA